MATLRRLQHGPIDTGEAVLVHLRLELAADLGLTLRSELEGDQLARPSSNAMGDIIAGDEEVLARAIATSQHDVAVRVGGVEVVDGDPVQLHVEIGLHLGHQIPCESSEVCKLTSVLRRDDEAELMGVALASFEKGADVSLVVHGRIKLSALAFAGRPIPLQILQMRTWSRSRLGELDHPPLHNHTPRTGRRRMGAERSGLDETSAAAGAVETPAPAGAWALSGQAAHLSNEAGRRLRPWRSARARPERTLVVAAGHEDNTDVGENLAAEGIADRAEVGSPCGDVANPSKKQCADKEMTGMRA